MVEREGEEFREGRDLIMTMTVMIIMTVMMTAMRIMMIVMKFTKRMVMKFTWRRVSGRGGRADVGRAAPREPLS